MIGSIGFLALSLGWRVLIVRLISVLQWGEMSLAFAIIAVLTTFASLGINESLARSIAYENESERRGIVYSGLTITVISGLICTIALFIMAGPISQFFRDPELKIVIEILSPSIFLSMFVGSLTAVFQGFQDVFPRAFFVNILPNAISIVLALLLYYLGFGFIGILLSAVLNGVVVVLIMAPYSRRRLRRYLAKSLRKNKVRMLLMFGLPLLVVTGLGSIMGYADTLILAYFRNETVVGYYAAGLTLGRVVNFSMSALGFIFLPVAAQFFSLKNFDDLKRTYSTATKWSLMTSIPLVTVFVLYPAGTLGVIYGSSYQLASGVLTVSAASIFAGTLFGPASVALVAFGRTRLMAVNSVISVSANIVASFTLIPSFGMLGGAYAAAVGRLTFGGLCLAQVIYLYKLHPFDRRFIKSLAASLTVSLLILVPLNLHPGLAALALVVVGVAFLVVLCVLITKSVDTTDVLLLEVAEGILGRRLKSLRRLGTFLVGKTS